MPLSVGFSEDQLYHELTHKTSFDAIQSWGCYKSNSGIVKNYSSACMSNASNAMHSKEFWIHNARKLSNRQELDDPIFFAWTCWISDPDESPWKSVLPKEAEYIVKGKNIHSVSFRNRYGWFFNSTDHTGYKSFINFCKTIRNPTERHSTMVNWFKLVELGVHPALAYVLCPCIASIVSSSVSIYRNSNFSHGVVDVNCLSFEEVRRFALGEFKDTSSPLSVCGHYIGNDGIWKSTSDRDIWQVTIFDSLNKDDSKKLGCFNKVPVTVVNTGETSKVVPMNKFLEVLEAERIKMGLSKSHLLERIASEKRLEADEERSKKSICSW